MNPISGLVVFSTCPDRPCAEKLARQIVQEQLAACVSLLPPMTSIYRWEGRIEEAEEVLLLIKTQLDCYPALEACIRENHPYAVPEIVALPMRTGNPAYLDWLKQETRIP